MIGTGSIYFQQRKIGKKEGDLKQDFSIIVKNMVSWRNDVL